MDMNNTIIILSSQFQILVSLVLFMFFFWIGYKSEKRSGGGMLIFSGMVFFYLEAICFDLLSPVFVLPLMTPVAFFILLLGLHKLLYTDVVEKGRD